jgi:hypothetical protein
MNCQDFEKIVLDLARDQMMDAATGQSGLAHAEGCQLCAARLSDERALTGGLRALAAATATKTAPLRVEAALRAAFRQQAATPLPPFVPRRIARAQRHWLRWTAAAAAAILVLLALIGPRLWRAEPEDQKASDLRPAPSGTTPVQDERPLPPQSVKVDHNQRPSSPIHHLTIRHRRSQRAAPVVNASSVDQPEMEIATDFMPLGMPLTPLESGQVVRISVPRTTLAAFGLPVNYERAGEPVKADVLLSDDGIARAIRFVR